MNREDIKKIGFIISETQEEILFMKSKAPTVWEIYSFKEGKVERCPFLEYYGLSSGCFHLIKDLNRNIEKPSMKLYFKSGDIVDAPSGSFLKFENGDAVFVRDRDWILIRADSEEIFETRFSDSIPVYLPFKHRVCNLWTYLCADENGILYVQRGNMFGLRSLIDDRRIDPIYHRIKIDGHVITCIHDSGEDHYNYFSWKKES